MEVLYTKIGYFLIGIRDSLSIKWVKQLLFYTDPRTKRILPQSTKLQRVIFRTLIQAGFVSTLLPIIVRKLGYQLLGWAIMGLTLLFTYIYLVFYNMDLTSNTLQIITYKAAQQGRSSQLDIKQKTDTITQISNQIQSFIFQMVYYTPANLILIVISLFDETYFPWIITIMDSFFNTAFYYFRKWPYDRYNVAFLQRNMSYSLGYGFAVSLITNIMLPPSLSVGGYLILSQWMIINALCHSVPSQPITSLQMLKKVLLDSKQRNKLGNSYNIHRRQLKNKQYRDKLMKQLFFMKSFFKLTSYLNSKVQKHIFHRVNTKKQQIVENKVQNNRIQQNKQELTTIIQQDRQQTTTLIMNIEDFEQEKQQTNKQKSS